MITYQFMKFDSLNKLNEWLLKYRGIIILDSYQVVNPNCYIIQIHLSPRVSDEKLLDLAMNDK